MTDSRTYKIPTGSSEARFTDRGSKFLAYACTVRQIEDGLKVALRRSLKYHDASHHCWAIRVGDPASVVERFSDAGEPAGTAGKPILDRLRKHKLFDVVLVVTRWFGGSKLGKGGLIRAYGQCAESAIELLPFTEKAPVRKLIVRGNYTMIGIIERLSGQFGGKVIKGDYSEVVMLTVEIPEQHAESFTRRAIDDCSGRISVEHQSDSSS